MVGKKFVKMAVVAAAAFLMVPPIAANAERGDIGIKDSGHYDIWTGKSEHRIANQWLGGDVPYAKYKRSNGTKIGTLENDKGVGIKVVSVYGRHIWKAKGCYTVFLLPDICSDWEYDPKG